MKERFVSLGYEGPLYGQARERPLSSLGLEGVNLNAWWCGKEDRIALLRRLQLESGSDCDLLLPMANKR